MSDMISGFLLSFELDMTHRVIFLIALALLSSRVFRNTFNLEIQSASTNTWSLKVIVMLDALDIVLGLQHHQFPVHFGVCVSVHPPVTQVTTQFYNTYSSYK